MTLFRRSVASRRPKSSFRRGRRFEVVPRCGHASRRRPPRFLQRNRRFKYHARQDLSAHGVTSPSRHARPSVRRGDGQGISVSSVAARPRRRPPSVVLTAGRAATGRRHLILVPGLLRSLPRLLPRLVRALLAVLVSLLRLFLGIVPSGAVGSVRHGLVSSTVSAAVRRALTRRGPSLPLFAATSARPHSAAFTRTLVATGPVSPTPST